MRGLAGKRVLVTAGGAGIGRALAAAFLGERARVWICDLDPAALASTRRMHPELSASRTDVADAAAVDAMFDALERAFGGLDVLVNNAGIAGPTGPIENARPGPLAALRRGQSGRRLPVRAARGAAAQGGGRRRDRQHLIHRRAHGLPAAHAVCRRQMGGGARAWRA